MIKLKQLLNESSNEAVAMALRHYWNFVLNAISGHNPDSFYRAHRQEVDFIAKKLLEKYGPSTGGTAWRGILLEPSEVHNGKVRHVEEITYVSFSEDKRIAIAFGDTENPMAEYAMERYPNKKGYLITADWRPDQLLFHHKWMTDANMWGTLEQLFGDAVKYIRMQQELILKPKPYYYVEPVPPGASDGLEVGT
jgi:hypothetical protein